MKEIEKFLSRLKKQLEAGSMATVSTDPDELIELHIGANGEIYLDRVLTPYSISDVARICHKYDEECEDYSYVKMYFENGDWLSVSYYCEYSARIQGTVYYNKAVLTTYYSITNTKMEQCFSTQQEFFDQISRCAEKADIDIAVPTKEDDDAEIWFDDHGALWINTTHTPYTLDDIEFVGYYNSDTDGYVTIYLKSEDGKDNISKRWDNSYHFKVSSGKIVPNPFSFVDYSLSDINGDNHEISHHYQNIIEAKKLGIFNDEYVVLNGVLIKYNGENKDITIPEGVQIVEEGVFSSSAITRVKCPSTLKCIREVCFLGCWKLQSVELNEGLETIEKNAFWRCESLENINRPSTLKSIGDGAFGKTPFEGKI